MFDVAAGVPRSVVFRGTMTAKSGDLRPTRKILLEAKMLEGEALTKALTPPAPPKPAAPPAAATPKVATADQIDALVKQLSGAPATSGRAHMAVQERRAAADQLALIRPVDAKRAAVVAGLKPMFKDSDMFLRWAAAKALKTWAGPDDVLLLVEVSKDSAHTVRGLAYEALSNLGPAAAPAAEALAGRVGDFVQRQEVLQILGKIGMPAETAVRGLLGDSDGMVRAEAAKLLEKIGTSASLEALKAAQGDDNPWVKQHATAAVKAISARK